MRRLIRMIAVYAATIVAWAIGGPAAGADRDPAVAFANRLATGDHRYREGSFGTGDARLHYVEVGRGPLILLYHGFPSTWLSWRRPMEMLKHRYRVVAVDGLGAGRSAKPTALQPYRVARLARGIDALARHLAGGRRFVLVGHDWGAALAFAYAQAYPNRLHAVIGLSAPPYNQFLRLLRDDPDQRARSAYMQRFRALGHVDLADGTVGERLWRVAYGELHEKGLLTDEEWRLFGAALADPRAVDGGMNWYRANIPAPPAITARDCWPGCTTAIAVPALLIWGEADGAFVPAFVDRFTDVAPRGTVARWPGIGHWPAIEAPDRVSRAIVDFLDAAERRRARQ